MTVVPVLEIGGTHVTGARVHTPGWRVEAPSVRRRPLDARAAAADLLGPILAAAADAGDAPHDGRWGVAIPAPFDYAAGVAWFRGVGKFESLHGVDVAAQLRRALEPPPRSLRFLNDADAFVLGEWTAGGLAGCPRAAGLTLGTGVGSGFLVDGSLVHTGPGVPPGGRVNELRIEGAPLEDSISRRALRRAYAAATGDATADVADIAERADRGDPAARSVLSRGFRALGAAIGPLLEQFDAGRVVIGGSMAASWELVQPWFVDGWTGGSPAPIEIVISRRADESALIGAAAWALS